MKVTRRQFVKGGVAAFTVTFAAPEFLSDVVRAELAASGSPVGVSVVFPGRIRTGMNPIGTVEPSRCSIRYSAGPVGPPAPRASAMRRISCAWSMTCRSCRARLPGRR